VWVPSQFVKPHGPPGPKDEEAETGRLASGQGTTEVDSSTDQRVAKEMATDKTDTEQQATHLGSRNYMMTMVTSNLGMAGNPQ
jgi:hypothetical protein